MKIPCPVGTLFIAALLMGGCSFDPTQTTTLVPYPTPIITGVKLGAGSAVITVQSWVGSADFIQYNVYLADSPAILDSISNDDINGYPAIADKSNLKASIPYYAVPTGGQYGAATLTNLVTGRRYWAAVTCLGSNQLLGSLRTNRGWFESGLSAPVEITPRPEMGFNLTNFFFTNAGSALDFDGTNLAQTSPGGPWASISALLVSSVWQNGGLHFPALSIGTGNAARIQAYGSPVDRAQAIDFPIDGWAPVGTLLPVAEGNLLLVKTSNVNLKILITNISGTVSATNSPILFGGFVAWQTNLSATRL
jgi:hypothetical protein